MIIRPPRHVVALAAALLAGCASAPPAETPAADAAAPPAGTRAADAKPSAKPAEDSGPPLEKHEAAAQCWMKYDKSGGSLDAKAKLVDKCIDEKMKAVKR